MTTSKPPDPFRAEGSALRRRARELLAAFGVIAGIVLAGYGQYAVSTNEAPFSFPLTGWLDDRLFRAFQAPSQLAFAIPLFIAGGALFAIAAPAARVASELQMGQALRPAPYRISVALAATGVLLWTWLVLHLWQGDFERSYVWVFAVALLLPVAGLAAYDLRSHRVTAPQIRLSHLGEMVVLAGIVATFVILNARDLEHWRFAAIGDEGRFYDAAVRMVDDRSVNWFSHDDGPYGQPILGSAWHALTMAIWGRDLFGWKMGALTAIAITLPALYWLLREAIGTRVAMFGALFMGASHYLFAYAHTGYNNVFPLFPTISALALVVSGFKRASLTLLFLAGVMTGLGCYTYFSSRATIFIIALALLTTPRSVRSNLHGIAVGLAGFALTVVPLFAVEGWEVISNTFERSAVNQDTPLLEHLTNNTWRTLFAFNFNPHNLHYTAGALLDEITVTLALLGLALCLRRARAFAYRLVVIWFVLALIVTGVFSDYEVVTISRLHYALPPLAAFAAISLDRGLALAGGIVRRPRAEFVLSSVMFAALAPTLFIVNSRHFHIYSAAHSPTTVETVIIRVMTDDRCSDQELRGVAYLRTPDSLLYGTYRLFDGDERPLQIAFADMPSVYHPFPSGSGAGCVAFAKAEAPSVAPFVGRWQEGTAPGDYRLRTVTDGTGASKVEAVFPAGPGPGPDAATIASAWRTRIDLGAGLDGVVQGHNKDGIPPLNAFTFSEAVRVTAFIDEPVVVLDIGGDVRAYPERVLAWHIVLNDVVGGVPVAVTFDPIAGAARVYDRRLPDGRQLTLGVSGLLRGGNSLLFDRETETWWQQITGGGVTGELHDVSLQPVPFDVVAFEEYARRSPNGRVLDTPLDTPIRYRLNGYLGYDIPDGKPLFTRTSPDARLPAMQRVAVVELSGRVVALPYPADGLVRAYTLERDGDTVAIFFDPLARSPLEGRDIPSSRSVGSITAFRPQASDGGVLRFDDAGQLNPVFRAESGETFDVFGRSAEGRQLERVPITSAFWFSVAAAYPAIEIMELEASVDDREIDP